MKQTFSVVTTWGLPHWDTHAKRSVQSIIDQWPQHSFLRLRRMKRDFVQFFQNQLVFIACLKSMRIYNIEID